MVRWGGGNILQSSFHEKTQQKKMKEKSSAIEEVLDRLVSPCTKTAFESIDIKRNGWGPMSVPFSDIVVVQFRRNRTLTNCPGKSKLVFIKKIMGTPTNTKI